MYYYPYSVRSEVKQKAQFLADNKGWIQDSKQVCLIPKPTPLHVSYSSYISPSQHRDLSSRPDDFKKLTVFSALRVVSSRDAATQPSSVEPPSHMPAKAAMLLRRQEGKTSVQKC